MATEAFLARILGPPAFGLYAIGWTLTRLLAAILPLGLDVSVIRFGSSIGWRDESRRKGVLLQCAKLSSLSGILAGVGLYLGAPWLSNTVFHLPRLIPVFHWFALALPLAVCLKVSSAATRISQRMKFSVYAEELTQPTVALVLVVAAFLLGYRLIGAVAATAISIGFALLVAIYYVRKLFPEVISNRVKSEVTGKEFLLFSLPVSLTAIFGTLVIWIDRLFVGAFRSAGEAGIYNAASQLAIALGVILSGFAAIVYPMFADLYLRGKRDRLQELVRVSTKWSLYLSLPLFLVMCFAPGEIMRIFFGNPYVAGWHVLPILGAGQLANAGTGPTAELLLMSGFQNRLCLLCGGTLLMNLLGLFLLVPRWGMASAAWSTAGAVAAMSLLSLAIVKNDLGMWPYDRRCVKGVLAAGTAAGALWFARRVDLGWPLTTLTVLTCVSVVVFAGVLFLLGLDREDLELFRMVLERANSLSKV